MSLRHIAWKLAGGLAAPFLAGMLAAGCPAASIGDSLALAGDRSGKLETPPEVLYANVDKNDDPVASAKQALVGFDSFVNDAIKSWEVPGLALAVVKNGQVVYSNGFGFRDVSHKLPVTPRTLFAIGSCTKAFTTFVMGTLVDEGKMSWDVPVRTYIPEIRFQDHVATELMTPRDLVTHRSGLPRHDMIWYNASLSPKDVVARLPYLEPSEPFRSKFQYNNVMFMTSGYLIERLTGQPWSEAVRARVFTPLAMTASNFSVKDSQRAADFAKPYADRDDKIVAIPFRDITNVGPAGSINSNVEDMSRWLAVHTHKGKIDGRQIISAAVLTDIHTPHMTTGAAPERPEIAPAGYALGWGVDEYRGHRRVLHGGGIDGFVASTVIFPDDGLGFVVFANLGGTALPELVVRHAADRILGLSPIDWSGEELAKKAKRKAADKAAKANKDTVRRTGTSPAHPLEEYAGEYEHPGYGVVKIELRDGKLHLEFNGIHAPLEHWHFEVFRGQKDSNDPAFEDEKVQFLTNVSGYVDAVAIPFEPRLKPIVFTMKPDARLSDPRYLEKFTGEYVLAVRTLGVHLKGNTLVLDSDGQGAVHLVPDRNDAFQIKEQPGSVVRFKSGAGEDAGELTLENAAGVFTAKRKGKSRS